MKKLLKIFNATNYWLTISIVNGLTLILILLTSNYLNLVAISCLLGCNNVAGGFVIKCLSEMLDSAKNKNEDLQNFCKELIEKIK